MAESFPGIPAPFSVPLCSFYNDSLPARGTFEQLSDTLQERVISFCDDVTTRDQNTENGQNQKNHSYSQDYFTLLPL